MKNIIVTGGLGFIGSNLVEYLVNKKYFVIIIDNLSYSSNIDNLKKIPKNKYKIYYQDIQNRNKNLYILKKYHPVAIFNLAAETHVDRSIENPYKFIKSNILGVFGILESLKKYLNNKKNKIKLIHVSTDEVYGDIKKNKLSKEKDPYLPSSPYAASKAASDLLIQSYIRTYNLPCIITNCCNNYGPKQFPEKLIPKIIINLLDNKKIPIYGNGKQEREWIHVEDHCSALYKIFLIGKIGEQINIGSGEVRNNLKLTKVLINNFNEIHHTSTKSTISFVKDRPGHDKRYALNSNKLKKKYKWKKKYNLQAGLYATVKWYLANDEWIKKINKQKFTRRLGLKF